MDCGCKEELNAQLQALSSRGKSLELTVAMQGLVLQVIGELLKTITSILRIPLPQPLPIVLQGPAGLESMLSSAVQSLGLPLSLPALPNMAAMLMGFTSVLGKMSAMNLAVPAFPSDLSANITGALDVNMSTLNTSVGELRGQLAAALEGGDTAAAAAIQGQLDSASEKAANAKNAVDSAANFFSSTNNMSTGTTASCKMVKS